MPDPIQTEPPATKPGYKTTEFWLKLAAILLSALFASDIIPTGGTAGKIAAIAATMLGALGYTVSRSLVKAAGALFVIALLAGPQLACTHEQRVATPHAIVDCTLANAAAIGGVAAGMLGDCRTPTGGVDWKCVEARAIPAGVQIGGCAFLEVVASQPVARVASATGEPPPERSGVAAFESYRASVAGGAAFRTSSGVR